MSGESNQSGARTIQNRTARRPAVRVGAGAPTSWQQWVFGGALVVLVGTLFVHAPGAALALSHHGLAVLFLLVAAWRLAAVLIGRAPPAVPLLPDERLPTYSVIVPLYREAEMVQQIVGALKAVDYPRERLQVLFALEADDDATISATQVEGLPAGFEVVIVPPGAPRTKPRACNHALARATGELVTIYDAEDRPEPGQLREAAARFAAGPSHLACLQAPLRIALRRSFLPRQFALEYAALFEVFLPALARLGLPFPLGGTSNHFHTATLRTLGGWDPYNVTEDADLGFRLGRAGFSSGVLAAPTYEDAPETFYDWLPQRTRWLKGYMQTLAVQTRTGPPPPLIGLSLALTVGVTIASAAVHLPMTCWLLTYGLFWVLGGPGPTLTPLDLAALIAGVSAATLAHAVGARRAGLGVSVIDLVAAPFYWPLLTFAVVHAVPRLFLQPFHWDKTAHKPWLFPPR
jgi:cellulose synthase/poly-beta-1,6-N-acetylglucosamine synthase-like glycosyltransferase